MHVDQHKGFSILAISADAIAMALNMSVANRNVPLNRSIDFEKV